MKPEDLFDQNTMLAYHRAWKFRRRVPEQDFEDLKQVALTALWKACLKFDLSRGFAFSTYAVPTIDGEIRRWLREERPGGLRLGRPICDRIPQVRQAYNRLEQQLGRSPTTAEVAESLGLTESEVVTASTAGEPLSIEEPVRDLEGEVRIEDTLATPDTTFEGAWVNILLETAERVEPMLADYARGMTQMQIARKWSISQAQVCRRLNRGRETMRRRMGA